MLTEEIFQSLSNAYSPYQGFDVRLNGGGTFGDLAEPCNKNEIQWDENDDDKRKPLGCFNYVDDNIAQGIESAKLAAQGLLEAPANIAKFTNKLLRDMSLDGNLRNKICDEEVAKAKDNMINKAKNQTSQFKVSTDQIEKLNSAATDLVDDVKILAEEQLSEFENTYSTNFSSRSNPRRRRR